MQCNAEKVRGCGVDEEKVEKMPGDRNGKRPSIVSWNIGL
jgi:hypothetical protein